MFIYMFISFKFISTDGTKKVLDNVVRWYHYVIYVFNVKHINTPQSESGVEVNWK